VRILTFIKIIRLSKLLETAKELKHGSQNIDLTSLTLADLVMSKRRGHQHLFNKQQNKKRLERKSVFINPNLTKVLINSKINNIVKKETLDITESENRQFIHPTKLNFINNKHSKIKVPLLDPNIEYSEQIENHPNFITSNSQDVNSKIFLLNNCSLTLLNVTNNFNNPVMMNSENLYKMREISEEEDTNKNKDLSSSSFTNREQVNERDAPCVEYEIKIDELESDDLNFINKEIKSENGNKNFKNPLRIELENFLKINAIELEDLFDKNIVLIAEKDENKKKGRRSTFCRGINHFLNKIEQLEKTKHKINGKSSEEDSDRNPSSSDDSSHNDEDKQNSSENLDFSEISKSCDLSGISQENISNVNENSKINENGNLENSYSMVENKRNSNTKKKCYRVKESTKLVRPKSLGIKFGNTKRRASNPNNLSIHDNHIPNEFNSSIKFDEVNNQPLKLLDGDEDDEIKLLEKDSQNKNKNNNKVNDFVIHLKPGAIDNKEIQKIHQSSKINKRKKIAEEVPINKKEEASPNNQNSNQVKNNKVKKQEHTETVEEKLTSRLANKLVVVIMAILVIVPVLDLDYIDDIRFTSDQIPTIFRFCVEGLDVTFIKSIKDPSYMKTLNLIYKSCLDLAEDGSFISEIQNEDNSTTVEPFFYNINFTEYPPYDNLYKIAETDRYLMLLMPNRTYQHPNFKKVKSTGRENQEYVTKLYYPDESDSRIVIIYNNNTESSLTAGLNILKVLFIAIILLSGVFMFSNDIHLNVTRHLDKITIRVKNYLNNTDSLTENIKLDSSESGDIRTAYQKALLLLDEKEDDNKKKKNKNDDEIYVIDKNIKIIINLISISIGKPSMNISIFFNNF
jgi:hypothetical protein